MYVHIIEIYVSGARSCPAVSQISNLTTLHQLRYSYLYIYIYRDERRPRTDWESLSKGNPYPCPKKLYRLPAVLFVLYNGVIHIVMHCCLYIVCYTNFRLYFFVKHLLCKLCFVIHDCLVYTSFVIHCLCICYT